MAVIDPSKPTIFDIGIDDDAREIVRCSGAIICTGTGSSAWFQSATNIHSETAEAILSAFDMPMDDEKLFKIEHLLLGRLVYPIDSDRLAYVIREPIINKSHSCKRRQGQANRISIRTLSWEGQISIDGVTTIPFKFGSQVVLKAGGPDAILRSARFDRMDTKYVGGSSEK